MRWRSIGLITVAICALGALLAAVQPAHAIPVFATKYGFDCTMCHSTFPRLNDFGQRFRANGYQIPGREAEEKTVIRGPVPLAIRTTAGYTRDKFDNTPDAMDLNQFRLEGFDLLSGGVLKENVGYFLAYTPQLTESRGIAGQPGRLEQSNVIFSNISSTRLSVRVGRFEPTYVAFSVLRQLTLSPYEVYDFAFPGGTPLGDTQTGIELAGYPRPGCSFALGWLDGSETNDSGDAPADFYLRAAHVFGRGEGQTAGQRVGAIGYFGRARSAVEDEPTGRQSFNRFGIDASLNWQQTNVDLQWLKGSDDGALWGLPTDFDFSGGFIQATQSLGERFVGFGRYDFVNLPREMNEDISRFTLGGRYYIEDHIAWHTEFSHRNQNSIFQGVGDATEDFFTTRLDFAF